MHKHLLKYATDEQVREFADGALSMLKETHEDVYDDLELYFYKMLYGKHFCEWMLKKATEKMINEDGTVGPHWSLEQTNSVAKNNGISFVKFNEYDFNYVMNMMYSDYYGSVPNETNVYTKMAVKFLDDKDAKEGKAFCYYIAMRG